MNLDSDSAPTCAIVSSFGHKNRCSTISPSSSSSSARISCDLLPRQYFPYAQRRRLDALVVEVLDAERAAGLHEHLRDGVAPARLEPRLRLLAAVVAIVVLDDDDEAVLGLRLRRQGFVQVQRGGVARAGILYSPRDRVSLTFSSLTFGDGAAGVTEGSKVW